MNALSDVEIIADFKRLFHILFTVVGNAFKFTSKGHINVSYELLTNGTGSDAQLNALAIKVEDTGIGMDTS